MVSVLLCTCIIPSQSDGGEVWKMQHGLDFRLGFNKRNMGYVKSTVIVYELMMKSIIIDFDACRFPLLLLDPDNNEQNDSI